MPQPEADGLICVMHTRIVQLLSECGGRSRMQSQARTYMELRDEAPLDFSQVNGLLETMDVRRKSCRHYIDLLESEPPEPGWIRTNRIETFAWIGTQNDCAEHGIKRNPLWDLRYVPAGTLLLDAQIDAARLEKEINRYNTPEGIGRKIQSMQSLADSATVLQRKIQPMNRFKLKARG